MSDTIWLEVLDGDGAKGGDRDNSIMLKLGEELDVLALALGVLPLSYFYDNSALAEAYAAEIEDSEVSAEPVWFAPGDGRKTVEALLGALGKNATAFTGANSDPSRGHWPGMLLEELQFCLETLVEAERTGKQFHLLVVP